MTKLKFGLIADGNRRWAKSKNLPVLTGHQKGKDVIKEVVLEYLYNHKDFDTLVLYAFSTENWNRNPLEIKDIMNLYEEAFDSWKDDLIKKKIKVIHAGRKNRIPKSLAKKVAKLVDETKNYKKFTLILCLDYGSHDEIKRAVKKGGNNFEKYLEVPSLDLVVRTSGEQRLSNFCLWQVAYSEFIFYDKYLPALTKKDMNKIVSEYKNRNIRKGK